METWVENLARKRAVFMAIFDNRSPNASAESFNAKVKTLPQVGGAVYKKKSRLFNGRLHI